MSKKLLMNQLELREVIEFTEDTVETDWLDLTKYGDFDILIFDCSVKFNTTEWLTVKLNNNDTGFFYPNISGTTYTQFLTFYKLNNKVTMCESQNSNIQNLPTSIKFKVYYSQKDNKILAGSTITVYTGKFNI